MRLKIDELARELKEKGFTSDSNNLMDGLVEILSEKDFFYEIQDELKAMEDQEREETMTELDYLEKIGEV